MMKNLRSADYKGTYISSLTETLRENQMNHFNFTFKICKESVATVSVVIYFRKNYFLVETINGILHKLEAAGLIEYWDQNYIDEKSWKRREVTSDRKILTLDHLAGCFQVWAFGCCFSLLCFMLEIIFEFLTVN